MGSDNLFSLLSCTFGEGGGGGSKRSSAQKFSQGQTRKPREDGVGGEKAVGKPSFFSPSPSLFSFLTLQGPYKHESKKKITPKKPAMQAKHLLCLSSIFFNIVYHLYLYMRHSIPC